MAQGGEVYAAAAREQNARPHEEGAVSEMLAVNAVSRLGSSACTCQPSVYPYQTLTCHECRSYRDVLRIGRNGGAHEPSHLAVGDRERWPTSQAGYFAAGTLLTTLRDSPPT